MTAITDFTTILETLIGRPLVGAQLADIGASFVRQDPYQLGGWNDTEYSLINAIVTNGGTGYVLDDILTVVGGTGTASTLRVRGETGGVIVDVSVETNGAYTTPPSNPISVTGGTGSGATFTAEGLPYEVPRDPTNEEIAQLGMDTFSYYGKSVHVGDAGIETRKTAEAGVDEEVRLAQEDALADMT